MDMMIIIVILGITLIRLFKFTLSQDQWHAFENKAYYVYNGEGINFTNAEAECRARQAHLPVITTNEHDAFISRILNAPSLSKYWLNLIAPTPTCSCKDSTNEKCIQCRESWQWRDGTPMNYYHWWDERPNGDSRQCAFKYSVPYFSGYWDDTSCNNTDVGYYIFRYACQYDCVSGSCWDHTCSLSADSYHCNCPPGYIGMHCDTDVDECASNPCQHESTCHDSNNSFVCECQHGYTGSVCDNDINECEAVPCLNNGSCVNTLGSYNCNCTTGFYGYNCENDLDECSSQPCQNGGTCLNYAGSYSCDCQEGYTWRLCDNYVDYCESSPCDEDGACLNILRGYVCACYRDNEVIKCNQAGRINDTENSCNYDNTLIGLLVSMVLFIVLSLILASTTITFYRKMNIAICAKSMVKKLAVSNEFPVPVQRETERMAYENVEAQPYSAVTPYETITEGTDFYEHTYDTMQNETS